jgi:hypothetical protein
MNWQPEDNRSSGTQVDGQVPPRDQGFLNAETNMKRYPNYARFPGDDLGLTSRAALAALDNRQDAANNIGVVKMEHYFYTHLINPLIEGETNDILAWDWKQEQPPMIRSYEVAAITPDIFDITYYSVEPNFTDNYLKRIRANREALGIPSNVPIRGDLGERPPAIPAMNVQAQIDLGKGLQQPHAFYFVQDPAHLLTGWAPSEGQGNYTFPDKLFGKCEESDLKHKYKVPGSCAANGGRTGYSVKMVNRDALLSKLYKVGGGQVSLGAIRNPPPKDF